MLEELAKFEKEYIGALNQESPLNEKPATIPKDSPPMLPLECFCVLCPICGGNKVLCGSCLISMANGTESKVKCVCPKF
jgi:hypothetical protein